MINSLIPPALRFVLHNTGINSVPYWIWGFLFLYLRIPGEAALCRAVKASNKPGVAVVRQWLSPPHYHSHHGPDDCNYLPARSLRPVSFSDSQSALRRCFFVRLSFPLICSRPSACSSDVSHPLQQSINPLKWECKSVISEFTLTTHETVDIAQIGFSKKKPSHSRAVRPTACTYPVCFLAHQIWIVPPEDDSSNGSPICNPLCTTVCVFTWAAILETVRENKGRSKHAVHPWVARAPPGLTNSKHTGRTQHKTTQHLIWKWFTLALQ